MGSVSRLEVRLAFYMKMFQQKTKRLSHKEVCEKYQMQVATTPKLLKKMMNLPPRPPPPERAFVYRLPSPAPPPVSPDSWKMSLTQYRKPARYSEQVPSYEQSMLAVSRRIRNKSQPPPVLPT